MASDESAKSETAEYVYLDPGREEDLEAMVADLEVQVSRFASRVEQLAFQRQGLVALLRSIKDNGGCNTRHWRYIDRILATARTWRAEEDSGRH